MSKEHIAGIVTRLSEDETHLEVLVKRKKSGQIQPWVTAETKKKKGAGEKSRESATEAAARKVRKLGIHYDSAKSHDIKKIPEKGKQRPLVIVDLNPRYHVQFQQPKTQKYSWQSWDEVVQAPNLVPGAKEIMIYAKPKLQPR